MKDVIFDDFQNCVDESLIRHKSILDIITKLQESNARVSRAVVKAATSCGCTKITAEKQCLPSDDDAIENLKDCLKSHLSGELCESCRDVIEREIGNNIFYLTALCSALDLNLYDILIKEYDKMNTLGKYTLR